MRSSPPARRLPDPARSTLEPILPPVVWSGEGRPPAGNHACSHGLPHVLIAGIGRDYVPPRSPRGKTTKARLDRWLRPDAFGSARQQLAQRYREFHGTDRGEVLLGGSKKPPRRGGP